jgi:hypothetical protein
VSKEILTAEEPEAAYLRGVVRRISAVLERMREPGSWNLSTEAAVAEIQFAVAAAMRRPATNGVVIDDLYRKIGELETAAVDRQVDGKLLRGARSEVADLRAINERLQVEIHELRAAHAAQVAAMPRPEDVDHVLDGDRKFLLGLASSLVLLAEHGATLAPRSVAVWSEHLTALSARLS